MKIQTRIISHSQPFKIKELFKEIGVQAEGASIMTPKAYCYSIYLKGVPALAANILKQELLSAGGDFALPKDALSSRRRLDGLVLANLSQLRKVLAKLKKQPSSLQSLGRQIALALSNYNRKNLCWQLNNKLLKLDKPLIMAILNVTPDSFSGDGILKGSKKDFLASAAKKVESFLKAGAKIIDVGGESSRPKSKPVPAKEEIKRILPVIKMIKKRFNNAFVSLDTYKPEVAKIGADEGVDIINDIKGLQNKKMRQLVAKYKLGAVIMHMKGVPFSMQDNPYYHDVIGEIYGFFAKATALAKNEGISQSQIVLDPGIGFGKRLEDNLAIIKRLGEFKTLGFPLMLGLSRKSFLGALLKKPPAQRLFGTIASSVVGIIKGASILRVHDVEEIKDAILITQAVYG